jgi:hypothetical protein
LGSKAQGESLMASAAAEERVDPGRVIGRGWGVIKDNFVQFLAVSLLFAGAPLFVLQYLMFDEAQSFIDGSQAIAPELFQSIGFWWPFAASGLAILIGWALLQAALVRSTILHLVGRDVDVAGSTVGALAMVLPIIGLSICVTVLMMLGFLLLIIPGIMIYCALLVAVPALVEERRGVFASMARSRDLTRGSRWQVFILVVFFWIVSQVVNGVAAAITGVDFFPMPGSPLPDPIFAGAVNALAATLVGVFNTVWLAALYVELREVKEGANTDQLADVFA